MFPLVTAGPPGQRPEPRGAGSTVPAGRRCDTVSLSDRRVAGPLQDPRGSRFPRETTMSESSAASDHTSEEPEAEEPEVFTNRAARRAKGKTSAKPEVFTKGQRPVGRGTVQSPRQYGNRRSG